MITRPGLFLTFIGLGATTSAIPAVLPAVAARLGADLTGAVPSLFAGLLVGVLIGSAAITRFDPRRCIAVGAVLQGGAVVGVALAPTPVVFLASAALAGLGFGLCETAASVAAKAAATRSTASLLSMLTGSVAITAASVPLAIAATAQFDAAWVALGAVVSLHVVTAAMMLAGSAESPARARTRLAPSTVRIVLPLAAALFVFVGVESVFSGWSAVFADRLTALTPETAAVGTTAFWLLMALGRFGFAATGRLQLRPTTVFGSALAVAAVALGTAALLRESAPIGALVCIAVAVVAIAPGYAVLLGVALDRVDDDQAGPVVGALVAAGAVGGSALPALVLIVSPDPTAVATLVLVAAACGALVLMLAATSRRSART